MTLVHRINSDEQTILDGQHVGDDLMKLSDIPDCITGIRVGTKLSTMRIDLGLVGKDEIDQSPGTTLIEDDHFLIVRFTPGSTLTVKKHTFTQP